MLFQHLHAAEQSSRLSRRHLLRVIGIPLGVTRRFNQIEKWIVLVNFNLSYTWSETTIRWDDDYGRWEHRCVALAPQSRAMVHLRKEKLTLTNPSLSETVVRVWLAWLFAIDASAFLCPNADVQPPSIARRTYWTRLLHWLHKAVEYMQVFYAHWGLACRDMHHALSAGIVEWTRS